MTVCCLTMLVYLHQFPGLSTQALHFRLESSCQRGQWAEYRPAKKLHSLKIDGAAQIPHHVQKLQDRS